MTDTLQGLRTTRRNRATDWATNVTYPFCALAGMVQV